MPQMNSILIAEDESRLAAMLVKGLHKNGFEIAIASNGEQAVQMPQTGCFDLLLALLRESFLASLLVVQPSRQHLIINPER